MPAALLFAGFGVNFHTRATNLAGKNLFYTATAFFLRSCNKLETEIKTLKTSNARQRRVTQAHELADIIVDRLYSDEQQKYIDCIHGELARLSGSTSLHPL